jgi:hypothetical protein
MNLVISIPDGVALVAGRKQLSAVMRAVGNEVAQTARASIRAGAATKKRRAKRQSPAGQPPVSHTGQLARSIKVKTSFGGSRVTITDVAANGPAHAGHHHHRHRRLPGDVILRWSRAHGWLLHSTIFGAG